MVRSLIPFSQHVPRALFDFHHDMENLFDNTWKSGTNGNNRWSPPVNVLETDTQYEVTAELPGLQPGDVTVEIEDDSLSIAGKVEYGGKEEGKTFHRVERCYGSFHRVIAFPNTIEVESVAAEFQHGLLTVFLPKTKAVKPKKIEVISK